jgi:hypothetical protein
MNKNIRRSIVMATGVTGDVVPLARAVARYATHLADGVTRTACAAQPLHPGLRAAQDPHSRD